MQSRIPGDPADPWGTVVGRAGLGWGGRDVWQRAQVVCGEEHPWAHKHKGLLGVSGFIFPINGFLNWWQWSKKPNLNSEHA